MRQFDESEAPSGDVTKQQRRRLIEAAGVTSHVPFHILAPYRGDLSDPASVVDCTSNVSSVACALETAGQFEDAFRAHKAHGDRCGIQPWFADHGYLAKGLTGTVRAAVTPCGRLFVMKRALMAAAQPALVKDCSVLKYLHQPAFTGNPAYDCAGCVPAFYAFNGTCSSEWLSGSVPFPGFVRALVLNDTARVPVAPALLATPDTQVSAVKRLFRQGVHTLRMFRDAGVTHNDILFRNTLIRRASKPDFRLAFIDFCSAKVDRAHGGGDSDGPRLDGAGTVDGRRLVPRRLHGLRDGGLLPRDPDDLPPPDTYQMGCTQSSYDLFSFACMFIDALYVKRTRRFGVQDWRQRKNCVLPLPGVTRSATSSPPDGLDSTPPSEFDGSSSSHDRGYNYSFTLPSHNFEYVLWRIVQEPAASRVTNLEAVIALLDAVTTLDFGAVDASRVQPSKPATSTPIQLETVPLHEA